MPRVNIQAVQPDAYAAMFGLENYLAGSEISRELQELVRLRASLLNRCSFCINMHSKAAAEAGAGRNKLRALEDWQSSELFSQKEQAALTLTDLLTQVAAQGLPEQAYQAAQTHYSDTEIAQLIMLIATINAWNRLGISMAEH
ncbi:carboxymuconolactone decarboxylase family protein [Aliamphritea hakodatensis]|uniref:carboxymuconolactone decarboxylase family protein n=1 Tax=Aliamphritea hakodatensis TaxID=2895352 RepID=UPI0022FDA67F|nr:carboxymuconolactone decarboxylase family protein [Aliamphritea hakodatensis]